MRSNHRSTIAVICTGAHADTRVARATSFRPSSHGCVRVSVLDDASHRLVADAEVGGQGAQALGVGKGADGGLLIDRQFARTGTRIGRPTGSANLAPRRWQPDQDDTP